MYETNLAWWQYGLVNQIGWDVDGGGGDVLAYLGNRPYLKPMTYVSRKWCICLPFAYYRGLLTGFRRSSWNMP